MIEGRLVLNGELELITALHIGRGENEYTDLDVVLDGNEKPFIPFTSLIGVLKSYLLENYDVDKKAVKEIFGYLESTKSENDDKASVISGQDLFLSEDCRSSISIRDGIKLNPENGLIFDGGKYNYQVVDSGATFNFNLETAYSKEMNSRTVKKEFLQRIYKTIICLLNNDDIFERGLRVGAKTNNGLGRIRLNNPIILDYDYNTPNGIAAWLKNTEGEKTELNNVTPFENINKDFVIDAFLDLKTSLIQRSYNDNPASPDSSHIKSGNKYILAGSGAKGAIITRAKKIVNTIWNSTEEKGKYLDSLFGYVREDRGNGKQKQGKEKAKEGRILIEETVLPAYEAKLHTRIKIDRFTGAAVNGALFDSLPLFNSEQLSNETDKAKKYTRITIRIKEPG